MYNDTRGVSKLNLTEYSFFALFLTFSLYEEPNNCTDFKSTAFPFLPSFARRFLKHLLMQQKHIPNMTAIITVKEKLEFIVFL